jgi:hypothetical protein
LPAFAVPTLPSWYGINKTWVLATRKTSNSLVEKTGLQKPDGYHIPKPKVIWTLYQRGWRPLVILMSYGALQQLPDQYKLCN